MPGAFWAMRCPTSMLAAAGVENNIKLRGGHAPGHVRDAFRAAIEASTIAHRVIGLGYR